MKNGFKKGITLILIIFILLFITFVSYFATNGFYGIGKPDQLLSVEITDGMTGSHVASELYNSGIIRNEFAFKVALKLSGKGGNFKVGSYSLSPKMSYSEITDILTSFSIDNLIKVTIPEGYKITQIADTLQQHGLTTKEEFLKEVSEGVFDYDFITESLPEGNTRLEGYLFPDTYLFDKNSDAHKIIDTMLSQFDSVFTDEMKKRAETLGFSLPEIITLSSIIEKEGSGELEKISSVFHNRLEINMRLESCATVNYLFDVPKDVLSIADTYIESPYNTYRNAGLPPAPICSPGLSAINAALYPMDTDYLYFIADGKGGNLFSKTYDEHLEKKGNL